MKPLPGSQFPIEAYENFTRQMVPRWTSTDAPTIAAYTLLVDRICPCVIVFHSQAGQFAFKVAQARPDKIKALVAVEPGSGGDPAEAAALSGNSHMMMMDRNNLEVADVIQTWLEREGLYH
jgi:pimeloyl-ACP methyl ester carboxylesterase